MASKSETRAAIQEFDSRANNQATILQNGIDDYWSELYAVQALFASSNQSVTREEFEDFGRSLTGPPFRNLEHRLGTTR